MRQISTWASRHVIYARMLIVILKTSLYFIAAYTGLYLVSSGITIPAEPFYLIAVFTFLIALAIYPARTKKYLRSKYHYARQKTGDFLLPLCAFLVIACAVNNAGSSSYFTGSFASSIVSDPTAAQILASGKTKAQLTKKEKRILRHEFTKQLKHFAVAKMRNDQQKANDSWKIVLAVIALLGLVYLLAALSCSLSCNGSDAAAILVGVLGLAGLIWAFVAFVNHIRRPKKPKAG